MTRLTHLDDLQACSVPSWLSRYQKITLRTRLVPLPNDFIAYLKEDGIHLPLNECGEAYEFYRRSAEDDDDDDDDDSNSDHDILEQSEKNPVNFPCFSKNFDTTVDSDDEAFNGDRCFPDVDRAIASAISELDGLVFPKLNWSSPKDAAWISPLGSLKCACPGDIYLLLKSSDFIQHDLKVAEEMAEIPLHLVLRKWYDIQPSMEFRCFVFKKKLLGISQRDVENRYEHLKLQQQVIVRSIEEFWSKHIQSTFPLENYTFDVYLTNAVEAKRVWLIDFNPWREETDPLLFTWEELHTMGGEEVDCNLRLVDSMAGSSVPRFSTNMVPAEAVMLGQGMSLVDLLKGGCELNRDT